MKNYSFKNWSDFGMFYRVSKDKIVASLPDTDLAALDDFNKACLATHGGCGCTLKKRMLVAYNAYENALKFISENEELKAKIKELLNNPAKVYFNHPEGSDTNRAKGMSTKPGEKPEDSDSIRLTI